MFKIISKCFKTVTTEWKETPIVHTKGPWLHFVNKVTVFHFAVLVKRDPKNNILYYGVSFSFSFLFVLFFFLLFLFLFFFFFFLNGKIFLPWIHAPLRVSSVSQISREYRIYHQSVFTRGEKSWNRRSVQARIWKVNGTSFLLRFYASSIRPQDRDLSNVLTFQTRAQTDVTQPGILRLMTPISQANCFCSRSSIKVLALRNERSGKRFNTLAVSAWIGTTRPNLSITTCSEPDLLFTDFPR